jgi:hypothetical protein
MDYDMKEQDALRKELFDHYPHKREKILQYI